MTGSVNQRGVIQPIGGVNYKIEGFYAVCKSQGLTGRQGVMIPKTNEQHLMLGDEIVAAIAAGMFHIWSVESIEQGIEILTGMAAGTRGRNRRFPKGTLYRLVEERLSSMELKLKQSDRSRRKQRSTPPVPAAITLHEES